VYSVVKEKKNITSPLLLLHLIISTLHSRKKAAPIFNYVYGTLQVLFPSHLMLIRYILMPQLSTHSTMADK